MTQSTVKQLFQITITGLLVGVLLSPVVHAQEPIGGPYEPDSATVLLMHFDGDFQNEVYGTADAQPFGNISFETGDSAGVFGQQLWFDNDSAEDKSHLQIPDTSSLDLAGSWTLQVWVNVATFGSALDVFHDQKIILTKPGDPDEVPYYHENYFVNLSNRARNFGTGYYSEVAGTWIGVRSSNNLIDVKEWYHITFIRDTSKKLIVQMIHQNASDVSRLPGDASDSLKRVFLEAYNYEKAGETGQPRTSDQPLFIGATPQNDTLQNNLRGWVDEIHISNTVRSYSVPPIISGVTQLDHQHTNQDYEVNAKIQTVGDKSVASAILHYRVDSGSWKSLSMTKGADNQYKARIPSQPIGSAIDYWIEATDSDGQRATHPRSQPARNAYTFGVWADSTTVLHLPFDEGSGIPTDQTVYESELHFHSAAATPEYVLGDGGESDYAMQFNASDSTWLEISSPFHELSHFTLDFKFYARDSLPAEDTRLLAKGAPSVLYWSNYQVYFDPGGVLRPAVYMPDNDMDPCGSFTGGCLVMDGQDESVQAETWYQFQVGVKRPEVSSDSTGTLFARLIDVAEDTVVAQRLHDVEAGAFNNSSSLKIGGTGGASPYFNGLIDDIVIRNYVPDGYADSVYTDINEPVDLPQQVTLGENYPNPFNPTTQIEFSLPRASDVQLTVYDLLGRRVAIMVDGKRQAGQHSVTFDASNLSSGVYIYRLKAGEYRESRKMLLVK